MPRTKAKPQDVENCPSVWFLRLEKAVDSCRELEIDYALDKLLELGYAVIPPGRAPSFQTVLVEVLDRRFEPKSVLSLQYSLTVLPRIGETIGLGDPILEGDNSAEYATVYDVIWHLDDMAKVTVLCEVEWERNKKSEPQVVEENKNTESPLSQ